MTIKRTILILGLIGASSPAAAQTSPPAAGTKLEVPESDRYFAILPEGKTLPEGVMRVRAPIRSVTATSGFDADGKKQDLGLTLKATGGALVAEYGITDRLSAQLLLPYVISNDVGMDAAKFRQSAVYKAKYDAFVQRVGAKLMAQGLCASPAACAALIDSGYVLPSDTAVTLPTGETLNVKAGVPVKNYADALVVGAARPYSGQTGIGDLEVGVIYALFKGNNLLVSLGAGPRLPTGKFADVPQAYRPTGRGTLDLGTRLNIDYVTGGLVLSWQHQIEMMLMKGKKDKSSLLNDRVLNTADPTQADAVASGSDGKGNSEDFTRAGLRHVGFVRTGYNFGALDESLKALGTSLTYTYNLDAENRYAGQALDGVASRDYYIAYAVAATGLPYQIPVDATLTYSQAVAGRNELLTPDILDLTIRAYYRF